MNWKEFLGVTFWNLIDLCWILGTIAWVWFFVWVPFRDYFDLGKKSIR